MSNAILPNMRGLRWDQIVEPEFNTAIKRSVSRRELRGKFMAYPLWLFQFSYDYLPDRVTLLDLQELLGFYLARNGSFDSFLFASPHDNAVTDQNFGTGNGSTTQFQLKRTYGANGFTFDEPVQNYTAITNIKKAGVTQTTPGDYSVNSTGLVTFTSAPANGAALTWTGTYYYRCRFVSDKLPFKRIMSGLWQQDKFDFLGSTMNKV